MAISCAWKNGGARAVKLLEEMRDMDEATQVYLLVLESGWLLVHLPVLQVHLSNAKAIGLLAAEPDAR